MISNYFKQNDAMELCTQLFSGYKMKAFLGFIFVILEFGYDSLHTKALIALLVLLIADFLSAIFVAYKTGVVISSAKLFRTVVKIAIYFGLIYFMRITEYGLPEPVRYLDDLMITFAVATEMLSILENVEKLGYPVPNKIIRILVNLKNK